jgi:hypothetical protein
VWHGRLRKTRAVSHAWATLLWGAGWFVLVQLAAVSFLEWKRPEFYDPKYGCRLNQLRARLGTVTAARLFVILGSSRAEQGFRPTLLPVSPGQEAQVVFNLARGGSNPLLHLLTLRRLLADGLHPDCVLLEVFPPSLVGEKSGVTIPKATLRDLPLLQRFPVSWKSYAYAARDRALPWSKYRNQLLALCAPGWLSIPACSPERWWDARGGEWATLGDGVSFQEYHELAADAHRRYFRKLQSFHISAEADRALRELLELCRKEAIRVMLFIMPEAGEFRSWYPPATRERLSTYLAALQQEYGFPLIDAREWVPDDDFCDGHHLLRRGAATFTRRFGMELLSRQGLE